MPKPYLVEEPGGLRFYVGETAIHAGDAIDWQGSAWRFEWSAREIDPIVLYGEACITMDYREFLKCEVALRPWPIGRVGG